MPCMFQMQYIFYKSPTNTNYVSAFITFNLKCSIFAEFLGSLKQSFFCQHLAKYLQECIKKLHSSLLFNQRPVSNYIIQTYSNKEAICSDVKVTHSDSLIVLLPGAAGPQCQEGNAAETVITCYTTTGPAHPDWHKSISTSGTLAD